MGSNVAKENILAEPRSHNDIAHLHTPPNIPTMDNFLHFTITEILSRQ